LSASPYRTSRPRPPRVLALRLADGRRIADHAFPVVFLFVASTATSLVPAGRSVGIPMLAVTLVAGLATTSWLRRRCVLTIAWPYRTLSWTMPGGLFERTLPASVPLDHIASVGVAPVYHDDIVTHQVAFETTEGERVLLSADVNLGSFGEAAMDRRAIEIARFVEEARAAAYERTTP
jgi:hypothetical protein